MEPGVRLGDFVLIEKIGEGAFGAVFRAEQASLGREAVVKILHTRHAGDATARARFLREAQLASRLQHANAAHIYAFGAEPGGTPWIAMELVRGTPLSTHLLLSGALALPHVVALVDEIADVVAAAHQQGIVHRDLKPANVMVSPDGDGLLPKLLDFGLARAVRSAADPEEPAGDDAGDGPSDAALTRVGARLGTPFYMAPEQWLPGGVVDARTDQYALAVLAWECLVGHPPFRGTIVEIGRAHVQKPLPALGGALPAALDAVLARAAAKVKEDRFPSVSAFAAALRAAAGLGPEVLPALPAPLLAAIAAAPQPIAEAMAALQAARNAYQALEAVRVAEQTLLRYTAAVALAGRTRDAAAPIPEALGSLRRRAPDPEDWLELVADLLAPWRERPEAFPVSELARLFSRGIPAALLGDAGADSSGDVPASERLEQALADLAARTEAPAFLCAYPLVLPRAGEPAEVWMGPRRLHRAAVAPAGAVPTPGHPTLLDGEARPVLDLWPVAQAAPPSPGAPDELFLLAGPGARGARLWAAPLGLERQDPAVWEWLRATLDERKGADLAAEDAPWRGLRAYTRDDAARFFGRDEETQALANRLRAARLVAVVGPSGSGKSSLVQAGGLDVTMSCGVEGYFDGQNGFSHPLAAGTRVAGGIGGTVAGAGDAPVPPVKPADKVPVGLELGGPMAELQVSRVLWRNLRGSDSAFLVPMPSWGWAWPTSASPTGRPSARSRRPSSPSRPASPPATTTAPATTAAACSWASACGVSMRSPRSATRR